LPDTRIRAYTDQSLVCSDCGETSVDFSHNGPLLPKGSQKSPDEWKDFCAFCWNQRQKRRDEGKPSLPLGVRPPGVPNEFLNKAMRAKTESGSVYEFGIPDKEGVRTVSNTKRKLDYTKCKIFLANVGESMWLRIVDDPEKDSSHLVRTTAVKSIEALS